MHTCMSDYYNKITLIFFNCLFLNIHKRRCHGNQIGQHVTSPTKHKCKFKNQNLPYQQAQHNDLMNLQTLIPTQDSTTLKAHT
jgi:hypothetical protein